MPRKIQYLDWFSKNFQQKILAFIQDTNKKILGEQKRLISELEASWKNSGSGIGSKSIKAQEQLATQIDRTKKKLTEYDRVLEENAKLEKAISREKAKQAPINRRSLADLKKQRAETKRLTEERLKLMSSYRKQEGLMGRLAKSVVRYVAAWAGIQTILTTLRSIFETTRKLDTLKFSLSAVITSSSELGETQIFLTDLAFRYGQEIVGLTENYLRLRAALKSTNIPFIEAQKIYESITKTGAVLGLSSSRIELAFLAIEQMASKGTVSMEELRRQLGDQIPGAVSIMARALNVTIPQLYEMVRANEVLAEDALPKFARELEKTFGIENIENVDTLTAATNNLRNTWTLFVDDLKAGGTFKIAIKGLASLLESIRPNITLLRLQNEFLARASKEAKEFADELSETSQQAISNNLREISSIQKKIAILDDANEEYKKGRERIDELKEANDKLRESEIAPSREQYLTSLDIELTRIESILQTLKKKKKRNAEEIAYLETYRDTLYGIRAASDEAFDGDQPKGRLQTLREELAELVMQREELENQDGYYDLIDKKNEKIKNKQAEIDRILGKQSKKLKEINELALLRVAEEDDLDVPPFVSQLLYGIEKAKEATDEYNKLTDDRVEETLAGLIEQQEAEREYYEFIDDLRRSFGLTRKEDYEYELQLLKNLLKAGEISDADFQKARVKLWYDANKEIIDSIKGLTDALADALLIWNNLELQRAERSLDIEEDRVKETESKIDEEFQKKQDGEANSYDLLVSQLALEKEARDKAFEEYRALKEQQIKIDTIAQGTALLLAAAQTFAASSTLGPAGLIAAGTAIAGMFALFGRYKTQMEALQYEEPGFKDGVIDFQGKGTEKSDSNRIRISNHETIITADGTKKAPKMLSLINEGKVSDKELFDLYRLNMPEMLGGSQASSIDLNQLSTKLDVVNKSINLQTNYFKNEEVKILSMTDKKMLLKIGNITKEVTIT